MNLPLIQTVIVFYFNEGEIPDSFFEVTVDDIRVMLRDLKNERYHRNSIFKIIAVQEYNFCVLKMLLIETIRCILQTAGEKTQRQRWRETSRE